MFKKIFSALFDLYEYIILIILIGLSFIILMMNEVPQVRSIQGDIAGWFSFLQYPNMWINQLSGLVDENRRLKEENLRLSLLNAEMIEATIQNRQLTQMLNFIDTTRFALLPARVLNRGTTPIFNSITIDVGSSRKVKPNMPVISIDGIVGKTISVGDHSTLVQISNDVNFRLSVKFQLSRVLGIMQWRSGNLAEVREIAKTSVILPGERVITSGFSDIYPPNLLVGEVLEVQPSPDGIFQTAIIKPRMDINRIEEVFVITSF